MPSEVPVVTDGTGRGTAVTEKSQVVDVLPQRRSAMSPAGHLCFWGTAVAAPPRPGPRPFHAPTRRGGRGTCLSCIPFLPPPSLPVSFQAQLPEVKSIHLPGSRHTVIGGRRPPWPKALSSSARRRAAPRGSAGPFWWHVLVRTGSASGLHVVSVSTSSAVRRSHAFSNSFCSARRCEDPSESLHLFGSNRCSVSTGCVLPTTATPHPHTHTHTSETDVRPRVVREGRPTPLQAARSAAALSCRSWPPRQACCPGSPHPGTVAVAVGPASRLDSCLCPDHCSPCHRCRP